MLLLAALATACGQYTAKATVTSRYQDMARFALRGIQGKLPGNVWFSVPRDTPVHMEPVIDGEASFAGWSGACSGKPEPAISLPESTIIRCGDVHGGQNHGRLRCR